MTKWTTSGEYRSCDNKECRYFASDLNKFINKHCRKDMIANNIDLVLYRSPDNILRIVESKHSHESSSSSQLKILRLLSSAKIDNNEIEVYMISGNAPYETSDIMNIKDENCALQVTQENLIKFLNFELSFNDLTKSD